MDVAQVLVDCPGIEDLLSYAIPAGLPIARGDIVTVPLGKRLVNGIVMEVCSLKSDLDLRPIESCLSTSILPDTYWELLRMTSSYYATPLMQTVKVALPPKLLRQSADRVRLVVFHPPAHLTTEGQTVFNFLSAHPKGISRRYLLQKLSTTGIKGLKELQKHKLVSVFYEVPNKIKPQTESIVTLINKTAPGLTPRQAEVLAVLERLGGEAKRQELMQKAKTTYTTIGHLAELGCITIEAREVLRFGYLPDQLPDQPKTLNEDQAKALEEICYYLNQPQTILLEGVTGSGKTEVYLQAIAQVLGQNKSALVLVPEIGLTPQLTDRFCHRFGKDRVLIYHSSLSEGERFDTWRYLLLGEPKVIIGTRSAIFLPVLHLGMIILDEEHDPSFKQDQPQPCYHARTIAQWRSQIDRCPLILGSATPCAETLSQSGIVQLFLPYRIGNRPLPPITIVDMRAEYNAGHRSLFSRTLQSATQKMMTDRKQGILFVPRRGHSTFVSCRSCGYVMMCPHCDVSLSYHLTSNWLAGKLICHYCNYQQNQPQECPQCGSKAFRYFGSGTQKITEEINKLFPALKTIRFDSDTTRNKDQHRYLLEEFQQGKADLLIGTQMITKGIDIPQVTLVGVLAADSLLHLSDYRANERTFQLLQQVAGRAGRGDDPGTVIIQTYNPDHPVMESVIKYEYRSFMMTELEHRSAFNYPPKSRMAVIRLSSLIPDRVEESAHLLAQHLREQNRWEVLGAAPGAIPRIADRYHWQILLKAPCSAVVVFPTVQELRNIVKDKNVRITIDVDPLHIL